jgi:hypothetical protein
MTIGSDNTVTLTCVPGGATAPHLLSITVTPNPVPVATSGISVTVSLTKPAVQDTNVTLSSTVLSIDSGQHIIPAGQSSASFGAQAVVQGSGNVTATLGLDSVSTSVTVVLPAALTSVTCPASVAVGSTVSCTVTLNEASPADLTVYLSQDGSAVSFIGGTPHYVPAGQSSGTFDIQGETVGPATITVGATLGSVSTTIQVTSPVDLCAGTTPPPQSNATESGCDPTTGVYSFTCDFNWGDADHDLGATGGNGCEANLLTDPNNCGTVGHDVTNLPNATGGCVNGQQDIAACDFGYQDLDNMVADGCEMSLQVDINEGTFVCGQSFSLADQITIPGTVFVYHFTLSGEATCPNGFAITSGPLLPGFEYDAITPSRMVLGQTGNVAFTSGFYGPGDNATIRVYAPAAPYVGSFSISGHW